MKRIAFLVLSWMSFGCGGATSEANDSTMGGAAASSGGATGGSATGGSAASGGSAAGSNVATGGSAAASASARGAASLAIQNSAFATVGYGCVGAHVLAWGQIDASGIATAELAVTDGQNGASVKCTWSGDLTYELSGALIANSASFGIQGSAALATGTGTAQVSLFDPNMQIAMSDSNCTLQINESTIATGSYSSTVSCDHLVSIDDNYLWCALKGTFAFGGCGQ